MHNPTNLYFLNINHGLLNETTATQFLNMALSFSSKNEDSKSKSSGAGGARNDGDNANRKSKSKTNPKADFSLL